MKIKCRSQGTRKNDEARFDGSIGKINTKLSFCLDKCKALFKIYISEENN